MDLPEANTVNLKLKPSKKLREYLFYNLNDCQDLPDNIQLLKNQKQNDKTVLYLTLPDVKWLKQYMASIEEQHSPDSCSSVHFHELMEGTDVVLPEPVVAPRNPELEARIVQLKAQQTMREYRAMTKSVDNARRFEPEKSLSYEMRQINRQLIAVGSFIISVAAGFMFGFLGVELIVGDLDFGFRLILGVIAALVIALAEIYFLAKHLSQEDETIDQLNSPISDTNFKQHQE